MSKDNMIDNLRAANNDDDRMRIINNHASDLNDKDLDPVAGGAAPTAIAQITRTKNLKSFTTDAQGVTTTGVTTTT